jgi:ribosomal protein S18 acetylase RimI-like enzyme
LTTLAASSHTFSGLRPVNLKTDLAPLADLMELAFADSMDTGGRAAIREMRALSKLGGGLNLLSGVNDLVAGIGLGYVWAENGRLVGNVSIYPASLPSHLPKTWIIANVAVHPDWRGRGIARQLMQTSMDAVRARSGDIILQVEERNDTAYHLYDSLGFTAEGTFNHWRRPSSARKPPAPDHPLAYITRRSRGEWQAEYALAQRVRPAEQGGIGWLRPLDLYYFKKPLLAAISDALNLRSVERLIIRGEDERDILASLWIESAFGASTTTLTMMVHPDYAPLYSEALLNNVTRRFEGSVLVTDHPIDDTVSNYLLSKYQFIVTRTLTHMRWRASHD